MNEETTETQIQDKENLLKEEEGYVSSNLFEKENYEEFKLLRLKVDTSKRIANYWAVILGGLGVFIGIVSSIIAVLDFTKEYLGERSKIIITITGVIIPLFVLFVIEVGLGYYLKSKGKFSITDLRNKEIDLYNSIRHYIETTVR